MPGMRRGSSVNTPYPTLPEAGRSSGVFAEDSAGMLEDDFSKEDPIRFGLIPELIGCFPVTAVLEELDEVAWLGFCGKRGMPKSSSISGCSSWKELPWPLQTKLSMPMLQKPCGEVQTLGVCAPSLNGSCSTVCTTSLPRSLKEGCSLPVMPCAVAKNRRSSSNTPSPCSLIHSLSRCRCFNTAHRSSSRTSTPLSRVSN